MSSVRAYHEKMKLAFNKNKVFRGEIARFTLEDKIWLDIRNMQRLKVREDEMDWAVPNYLSLPWSIVQSVILY